MYLADGAIAHLPLEHLQRGQIDILLEVVEILSQIALDELYLVAANLVRGLHSRGQLGYGARKVNALHGDLHIFAVAVANRVQHIVYRPGNLLPPDPDIGLQLDGGLPSEHRVAAEGQLALVVEQALPASEFIHIPAQDHRHREIDEEIASEPIAQPGRQNPGPVRSLPVILVEFQFIERSTLVEYQFVYTEILINLGQLPDLSERKDRIPDIHPLAKFEAHLFAEQQIPDQGLGIGRRMVGKSVPRADLQLPAAHQRLDLRPVIRLDGQIIFQHDRLPVDDERMKVRIVVEHRHQTVHHFDQKQPRFLEIAAVLPVPVRLTHHMYSGFAHRRIILDKKPPPAEWKPANSPDSPP